MNGFDLIKVYVDNLIAAGINVPDNVRTAVDTIWKEQLKVKAAVDAQPKAELKK